MPLPTEALIFAFTLGGASLKLADIYGERGKGFIPAIVSSVAMALLISDSPVSSSIILGVILGVAFAGKIDQLNLRIGLVLTLIVAVILGFEIPDPLLLAVIIVAALTDEVGHDRLRSQRIAGKFFRFRMTLKTLMAILAILKILDIIHVIGFFCFDIAYDLTDTVWAFTEKRSEKI